MRERSVHWIWAALVVLMAAALFFGPKLHWLPRIPLTPSEFGTTASPPTDFLTGQDDLARRMYESASIASYSVVGILTILSLAVPLFLLYFNQVIDGMQTVLQAIFDEMREYRHSGHEVPSGLRNLYVECLGNLNEAQRVATSFRPIFNAVVGIALVLLIILLLFHIFAAKSILLYSLSIRAFAVSILLAIVVAIVLWLLASGHYMYRRIVLLSQLAVLLDPVRPAGGTR